MYISTQTCTSICSSRQLGAERKLVEVIDFHLQGHFVSKFWEIWLVSTISCLEIGSSNLHQICILGFFRLGENGCHWPRLSRSFRLGIPGTHSMSLRAGVKYVLSNTNTNTNTKIWIFQIQIQIQIFCSSLIQIQIQIQIHRFKYKHVQPNISAENCSDPK